jgi:hypothetical protein
VSIERTTYHDKQAKNKFYQFIKMFLTLLLKVTLSGVKWVRQGYHAEHAHHNRPNLRIASVQHVQNISVPWWTLLLLLMVIQVNTLSMALTELEYGIEERTRSNSINYCNIKALKGHCHEILGFLIKNPPYSQRVQIIWKLPCFPENMAVLGSTLCQPNDI